MTDTSPDLPSTLNTVDDVHGVCEAAGLVRLKETFEWVSPPPHDVCVSVTLMLDGDGVQIVDVEHGPQAEPLGMIYPGAPGVALWNLIQAALPDGAECGRRGSELEPLRARDAAAATAVVQAARAWKAKRDSLGWPAPRRAPLPEQSSLTEAADLYDAVTALDEQVRAHRGDQT